MLNVLIILGIAFVCVAPIALPFAIVDWIPAWRAKRDMRRQRETDPGAPIYRRVIELLEARQADWEAAGDHWLLKDAGIRVGERYSYPCYHAVVQVGQTALQASDGWSEEIRKALAKAKADRAEADRLNAVCDAIETLGASNVIPMRRGGINNG